MIAEENKDDYNWELMARDLALTTHLTHNEAFDITYELKRVEGLHPFDCYTKVRTLVMYLKTPLGEIGARTVGAALVSLLTRDF